MYKEETNAITDRAHLNSDKVSGEEFTLSEENTNEASPDPADQPDENRHVTINENNEPMDELQKLFQKISAERGEGGKATVKN